MTEEPIMPPMGSLIKVSVNGETTEVPEGTSVLALLSGMGFVPMKVAVEIDGQICPKRDFPVTELVDGNRLEIVSFVGGG